MTKEQNQPEAISDDDLDNVTGAGSKYETVQEGMGIVLSSEGREPSKGVILSSEGREPSKGVILSSESQEPTLKRG